MCMDVDKWQQFHNGKWIGSRLIHKLVTGSTNEDAAALSGELPHGAVIVADAQTAGRGRRGRTWVSGAGENLYFSLLLKPDFAPDKAAMLTLVMALAAARGMELVYQAARPGDSGQAAGSSQTGQRTGEGDASMYDTSEDTGRVQIKWPNDIVIHGKKVCGILTEMQLEAGRIKYVVIGVGVNIHPRDFEAEGLAHASSLEQELGSAQREYVKCPAEQLMKCTTQAKQPAGNYAEAEENGKNCMETAWFKRSSTGAEKDTREVLLSTILTQFEQYYELFCQAGNLAPLQEIYQARLVNPGREVQVLDPCGSFKGIASGIDEEGRLLVQKPDGSVAKVYAGEVSVRGLYGYV
ncbi:MAG: biotin--[Lachnospiraceae bacterium]|nr:biotin--[acetyl-CoA-carboxylase] ligase [Lachnospiraceae bacterium]